jgi:serine/threonine protein kinase
MQCISPYPSIGLWTHIVTSKGWRIGTFHTCTCGVCASTSAANLSGMHGPGLLGGRYELRDVLGFGGMAEVRDGWDTRLDRPVAIKLLYPGPCSQADVRERFKVEACAAAALNHPNIVGVYDFGDEDGTPFIVMERLPGDTLADQIAFGPLTQSGVDATLASVLAALGAAHAAGMLHRDIKPGNILLTPSVGVKVADFGIVKTAASAQTTTGQIVGTLAYLSPDRIAGQPAAVSDDLYAVGVVGYEALTGRKPFTQDDIAPLARAISEDDPPPLQHLRPDVDPRLAEVIGRAMSRDPLRRFASADDMRAALGGATGPAMSRAGLVSGSQRRPPTRVLTAQHAQPPAAVAVSAPRRSTRTRKVAGAAAILGALTVTALAFALDPSTASAPSAPEPAAVSTPTSAAVSPPVISTPAPTPVVEPVDVGNGNGSVGNDNGFNGNGHSGGHGNGRGKKPK